MPKKLTLTQPLAATRVHTSALIVTAIPGQPTAEVVIQQRIEFDSTPPRPAVLHDARPYLSAADAAALEAIARRLEARAEKALKEAANA